MHHRRHRRVGDDSTPSRVASSAAIALAWSTYAGIRGGPQSQPGQPGRGVGPQLEQRAAVPVPPLARLRDQLLVAREQAAADAAEALVEREVDAVEQRRRPRPRAGRRTAATPSRRAPSRWVAVPCERASAVCATQVVPRRQPAADLALRQLDQQRRGVLRHLLEVGERDELPRRRRPAGRQAVQPLDRLVLAQREVAGRVPQRRRGDRCGSAWIRSAICWAIVPLGINTAAGLPSSAATSPSSSVTTPPSP